MKMKDAVRQKSMFGIIAAVTLLTVSNSALTAAQSASSGSPGFMPWEKEGGGVAQLQIRIKPSPLTSVPGFAPWAHSRGETNQGMPRTEHELAAFEVIKETGAEPTGFRPWDTAR